MSSVAAVLSWVMAALAFIAFLFFYIHREWCMRIERNYSDLSDSATTFDPEEQFDRDIDERMKGMKREKIRAVVNGVTRDLPPPRPNLPKKAWKPNSLIWLAFAIYMVGQIVSGILILLSKRHGS
jgi:cytochrome b561